MENYTLAEEYVLPSKGLVYDKKVNPNIKLRSMTTEEEMKRLGHSERPYKILSEIIDDCLVENPGISSYDLCIGDFQFLFYKLRTVTYGSDYNVQFQCPYCDEIIEKTINLDDLEVIEYSELMDKYLNITLPACGKNIKLRLQTPRMLDDITVKIKTLQSKNSKKDGSAILFTIMSVIESVDGEIYNEVQLEKFVRSLVMKDSNYILQSLKKINIGIDQSLQVVCPMCEQTFTSLMPINGEFFGPEID